MFEEDQDWSEGEEISVERAEGSRLPDWAAPFGGEAEYDQSRDLAAGASIPEEALALLGEDERARIRARMVLIQGGKLAPVDFAAAKRMADALDMPVELAQALPGDAELELKARQLEKFPKLARWAAASAANAASLHGDFEWTMRMAEAAEQADRGARAARNMASQARGGDPFAPEHLARLADNFGENSQGLQGKDGRPGAEVLADFGENIGGAKGRDDSQNDIINAEIADFPANFDNFLGNIAEKGDFFNLSQGADGQGNLPENFAGLDEPERLAENPGGGDEPESLAENAGGGQGTDGPPQPLIRLWEPQLAGVRDDDIIRADRPDLAFGPTGPTPVPDGEWQGEYDDYPNVPLLEMGLSGSLEIAERDMAAFANDASRTLAENPQIGWGGWQKRSRAASIGPLIRDDMGLVLKNTLGTIYNGLVDLPIGMGGAVKSVFEQFGVNELERGIPAKIVDWLEERRVDVHAENPIAQWFIDLGRNIPQLGMTVGASLVNPLAGLGLMGVYIYGSSYNDLRDRGVDPQNAAMASLVNAGLQSVLERTSLNQFIRLFTSPRSHFARNVGAASLTEGVTEFLQKAPEYFSYAWAMTSLASRDMGERFEIFRESAFDRANLAQALKEGLYEGSLGLASGFLVGGIHYMRPGERQRRETVDFLAGYINENREIIEEQAREMARQSEAVGRRLGLANLFATAAEEGGDPESRRQRIEAALPEGMAIMYVSPADLRQMLERHGEAALAAYGVTLEQAEQAMNGNCPLPVATAHVLAHSEEAGRDARETLRDGPDGPSAAEARDWNPAEALREETENLLEGVAEPADFDESTPFLDRAEISHQETVRKMTVATQARMERSRIYRELVAAGVSRMEAAYMSLAHYSHAMAFYKSTGYDPAIYLASIFYRAENSSDNQSEIRTDNPSGNQSEISANNQSENTSENQSGNQSDNQPEIRNADPLAGELEIPPDSFDNLLEGRQEMHGGQEAVPQDNNSEQQADNVWTAENPDPNDALDTPPQGYMENPAWKQGNPLDPDWHYEPRYLRVDDMGAPPPEVVRRGNVRLGPDSRVVSLYQNRNVATVPHEFGHIAVDMLLRVASSQGAYAVDRLRRNLEALAAKDPQLAPVLAGDLDNALAQGPESPLTTRLAQLQSLWRERARELREQAKTADNATELVALARRYAAADRAAAQAVSHADAVSRAAADVAALGNYAGLSEEEIAKVLAGEDEDLYIRLQEASAAGFTQYLMEGRAPSQALAPAFARYAQWLLHEYGNARDTLGAPISPACRAVFDRLLADEKEIARYGLINTITPLLRDIAANAQMPDADRQAVGDALQNMATAIWDAGGGRMGARAMETYRKRREEAHYQRLGKDPLWQAAEAGPYNFEQINALLGETAAKKWRSLGLAVQDGAAAVTVWREIGGGSWRSAYDMIAEIHKRMIEGRETRMRLARALAEKDLEKRMRNDFITRLGNVSDQGARVYEMIDALLQAQILRKGANIKDAERLKRLALQQTVPRSLIKQMAREMIARDPVGTLTFSRFRVMLESSLKDCSKALRDGDIMAAANAFTRVRMANELLAESRGAGMDLNRLRHFAASLLRTVSKKGNLRKYDDRALEAMRRVFAMTGLYGKRTFFDPDLAAMSLRQLVESLNENATAEDSHGYAPILPDWLLNQTNPNDGSPIAPDAPLKLESLTGMQLDDVRNLLAFLRKRGRDLREEVKKSRQARIAALVASSIGKLRGLKPFQTGNLSRALGRAEEIFAKFVAHSDYFDFQTRRADGLANPLGRGEAGPLELGPMRALHRATDRARLRKQDLLQRLAPHLTALSDSMRKLAKRQGRFLRGEDGQPLNAPPAIARRYRHSGLEPDQLLAMALNCGNKSNMARLLDGYPDYSYDDFARALGDDVAQQIFAAWSEIQGVDLEEKPVNQGRRGILGVEDWQHIQGIWDALATQWPDIKKAYKEEFGFTPPPIEITPLQIAGENGAVWLKGGYYPVHYDSRLSAQIANWSQAERLLHSNEAMFQNASARRTFTKDRASKAVGYPVLLSTGILMQHVNEVSTFVELAHDAMFMWDILTNKDFRAEFTRVYGPEQYEAFKSNLRTILRPEPAPRNDAIYDLARMARKFLIPAGLGLNFRVAVIQQTALFQGMHDVSAKNVLSAMAFMTRHPSLSIRAVQAVSPYMRSRMNSVENDILDMGERLANPDQWAFEVGGTRITHESLVKLCLAPIACSDIMAATAVWLAAFNKRLAALYNAEGATVWNKKGRSSPPPASEQSGNQAGTSQGADQGPRSLFAGIPEEIFRECAEFADSMVMNANPDYDAINRSAFLRGKGAGYVFNMFASAVMRIFARYRIMKESLRQETISKNEYRRYEAYEFWAPGVAMSLFLFLMGAYWRDEPKEWARVFASNMLDQQLLRIPLIGSAIKSGLLEISGLGGGFQSNLRGAAPTVFEQPINTIRHVFMDVTSDKDIEEKARDLGWNVFELLSMASRLPLAPAARKARKGWEQYENGKGTPLSVLAPRPEKTKPEKPRSWYGLGK